MPPLAGIFCGPLVSTGGTLPTHCPLTQLPARWLLACLWLQVGSVNNTFGIKGVQEHCFFLKSIDDAHRLRVHVRCVWVYVSGEQCR